MRAGFWVQLLACQLIKSIKGPHHHKATHAHGPRRSHIPAPPQGGQTLHHASQSEAGLGGYERVATALVCKTRSFSTPFIFQWLCGVHKTDGRHLRRRLLSWGGRSRCLDTYVVPTYNTCTVIIIQWACIKLMDATSAGVSSSGGVEEDARARGPDL